MQIIQWDKNGPKKVASFSKMEFDQVLFKKVSKILFDILKNGDSAVRKYTKEFDGITIPTKKVKVEQGEINRAYEQIDVRFVPMLNKIIGNVKKYYVEEIPKHFQIETKYGALLGKQYTPIRRVGIYVPGGQAPLVSTVYMCAVPAIVAGVEEIIMATPPNKETGYIDPHMLVVADLLGIKEVYKIGGVQAIGAMAFGTQTIEKVDKIVGPGNRYVTEAKRQVYGFVDIDMTAGPSEVVIIADDKADPSLITCDMLSQAEHTDGIAILITYSKNIISLVRKQIDSGYIIHVNDLDEAVEAANFIAPEHLEILVKNPSKLLKKIRNAGAVFLGNYSPVVVGDYVAGPSHVLPTGGTAKFFSPLGVLDFMKGSQYVHYTKDSLRSSLELVRKMTEIEGLILHRLSIEARFPELNENKKGDNSESQQDR